MNLFLEQPKVNDKDSNICDSLMKLMRLQLLMKDCMQIPLARGVHSFCKVIDFIYYMVSVNK